MARKIKEVKPPPLSVPDHVLYWLFLLACLAWGIGSLFLYQRCQALVAQADAGMRMWYNTAWGWMVLPPVGAIGLVYVVAVWYPMPLFGNPKVHYGQYPYHEYAPVFSKTQPLKVARPEIRADKCRQTRIALVVFVLFLLLSLPGLCPRDTLDADGTLRHFDMLNHCAETIEPGEIRSVTLTARHGNDYRNGPFWNFRVRANGYTFYSHNFAYGDVDAGLRFLLAFRESMEARGVPVLIDAVDPITHLDAQALLPLIAADLHYTDEQTALLYRLFEP